MTTGRLVVRRFSWFMRRFSKLTLRIKAVGRNSRQHGCSCIVVTAIDAFRAPAYIGRKHSRLVEVLAPGARYVRQRTDGQRVDRYAS